MAEELIHNSKCVRPNDHINKTDSVIHTHIHTATPTKIRFTTILLNIFVPHDW